MVGGKQSLADTLIGFFPLTFEKYYEPFLGNGSAFFSLSPQMAVLSDGNKWLMDTYIALKSDWKKVVGYLEKMVNTNQEFLRIRYQQTAYLCFLIISSLILGIINKKIYSLYLAFCEFPHVLIARSNPDIPG